MSKTKISIPREAIVPAAVLLDSTSRVHAIFAEVMSFEAGAVGQLSHAGVGAVAASVTLTGHPYFGEQAQSARITFLEDSQPLTAPSFDPASGRISLYYPLSQYHAVADVLRCSKYILCIYWESPSIDQRGATLYTYAKI